MMMPSTRFSPESYSDGVATQDAVSFSHVADGTSSVGSWEFSSLPPYLQDRAASRTGYLDPYFQIPDLDVANSLHDSIPFSNAAVLSVPVEGFRQESMNAQRPCPTRTLDDDHSTNTQNHLFRINNDLQSSYWPIEGSPAAIDPALVQRVFHQSLVPTSTYSDTEFLFCSSSSSSRIESTAPMSFGTAPSDNFSAPSLVPHRFPRGRDKQVISRRRQRPAREFCRECDSLDFTVKRSLENHIMAEHLGMRFRCPLEGCMHDYRHMTSLGRHIRKIHRGIMERYMGNVGGA
ncbi:hypothetical protein CPB85DRAFT_290197 [Mucidula mucida]|nr:hypothetical protein CPB85DRAFT_290197 [Mucidula mucida]